MPALPAGTVTFLLTDVEGSTRLWETYPEAMRQVLARHDALASALVTAHNGLLVKSRGEGDSLFCVFPEAKDALAAALAMQQAFLAEPWPVASPVRVRMALHTGEADLRDGDYYGPPVNRCARLRAIGYGGQTLLSQAARRSVGDDLPEDAALMDVGLHQLKDLLQPEQVFQLFHPDLPADFPPLKSLSPVRSNLPRQFASFIGREREMAEVQARLAETSLLTLTGTGGTGKTRLSLQVAADVLDDFANGVWLVELAPITDAALAPQAVAQAVGLREEPGRSFLETLTAALASRRILLLLDNCEHLIEACARLAETLLQSCPHLKILATSREPLNIPGEEVWPVPPLSLPPLTPALTPESLLKSEAGRLFTERAIAAQPRFALTPQNVRTVALLCERLDGIPLAMELAAARVRVLSVEQIEQRLDDRFQLLRGGSRTALPRQQTLRALIDWSYELLAEPERALLRRLAVFAGGWTLEAAETICEGYPVEAWEMLDLLSHLVDKSLVIAEENAEGDFRYRLLESLRQYGHDRLHETDEAEAVRERHRDWFLALAMEAELKLKTAEQRMWINRLDREHGNFRAALDWSLTSPERAETALPMAGALARFWLIRGYLTEGRERLAKILTLAGNPPPSPGLAMTLNGAGILAWRQGDSQAAVTFYEQGLTVWETLGDRAGIAASFSNLGLVTTDLGDFARAQTFHERSLAIRRELGDRGDIANSLNNLGLLAWNREDPTSALPLYQECLAIRRELGDSSGIAAVLNNMGLLAIDRRDYPQADTLLTESMEIFRELGDSGNAAYALHNLGDVAYHLHDLPTAETRYAQGLAEFRELGDEWGLAASFLRLGDVTRDKGKRTQAVEYYREGLELTTRLQIKRHISEAIDGLASVAALQGDFETAALLFGAYTKHCEEFGSPVPPFNPNVHTATLTQTRQHLSETRFTALVAAGRLLTLDAIAARISSL